LPTIFWLKYCKADETAELIANVMGGGDSTLTSMTDSLVGGLGGGMLGGLIGLGGGGGEESSAKSILTSTGSVNIVADARLNALFVQANPADLQIVEMILEKVDQPESPEDVQITPKPLLIPVLYHSAKEISEVVKSVLGDRIAGNNDGSNRRGGGGGGQPSPQELIQALRGGGRGGNNQAAKSEPPKISISVDERSNSLIVIATPTDFEEVRQLVIELDEIGKQAEEIVQVVEVPGTMNAAAMVEALEALLGTQVSTTSDKSGGSSTPSGATPAASPPRTPSSDDIRARIEAFRARFGGGGPFTGGRGGAPGSRGTFGGGRPGGGAPGGRSGRGGR
jgi:type II secretory pathway component GspD/PulD (secretin)